MSEPDYLAQTGEAKTREQVDSWLRKRKQESKNEGCTWGRVSISEEYGLLLFEAWKEKPADEGEPRWQIAAPQEPKP